MADNPYVNKVQYGNQVLIDITDSTVEPNALLAGYKAYGADGAPVTGTLQLTYHITLHNAQYEALSDAVKEADENYFYIDDLDNVGVEMDDTVISASKVWSSQKVNSEIQNSGSGLIHKTQAEYDALPSEEKLDPTKDYLITDATLSGAPLDDSSISNGKVWSSQKVNNEIGALNSNMTYKAGDTITFTGLIVFGVSMSSNRVEFMLPLDKPIASGVTGVSVTAANLAVWTGSSLVSGIGIDRININGDRRTLDAATNSSSSTPSSTGKIYGVSGSITMTLTGA